MFLHLYEESSEKQKVDSNYFEVNWVSDFGEKTAWCEFGDEPWPLVEESDIFS